MMIYADSDGGMAAGAAPASKARARSKTLWMPPRAKAIGAGQWTGSRVRVFRLKNCK